MFILLHITYGCDCSKFKCVFLSLNFLFWERSSCFVDCFMNGNTSWLIILHKLFPHRSIGVQYSGSVRD